MNAASWVILAIIVVWCVWTVKSRLFKSARKRGGGCCGAGDADAGRTPGPGASSAGGAGATGGGVANLHASRAGGGHAGCDAANWRASGVGGGHAGCDGCTSCRESATRRNAVAPIVKELSKGDNPHSVA